jgi:prophage maintenance system killer protein
MIGLAIATLVSILLNGMEIAAHVNQVAKMIGTLIVMCGPEIYQGVQLMR